MRLLGIHHVNVRVDDLDEAADFYERVLSLTPFARPDVMPGEGRWYALGDQELHVSAGGGPGTASRQHVAVVVDDLPGALAELRAGGVAVEVREATGQAFVRDPSGNRIELGAA